MNEVSQREAWAVSVERDGETVVTLSSNGMGGRELREGDERTIRTAAEHLLSFIGASSPLPQGTAPQDLQALIIKWRESAEFLKRGFVATPPDAYRFQHCADELEAALSRPQGTETPQPQEDARLRAAVPRPEVEVPVKPFKQWHNSKYAGKGIGTVGPFRVVLRTDRKTDDTFIELLHDDDPGGYGFTKRQLRDLIPVFESALSALGVPPAPPAEEQEHSCVKCHHRWTGGEGLTEYCGDCHRAAVAAPPAAEWRDIETAPKDGTEVMLIARAFRHADTKRPLFGIGRWEKNPDSETDDGIYEFHWFGWRWSGYAPSHWMPLPAPPLAADPKEK